MSAQGTGRANDGADNRGQGRVLEGKGVILSFDAGDLIHVLQCHQAGHLLPCVSGPLLNPSSGLQEAGNSGLANFYFKCSIRLHKNLGRQRNAFFDVLGLLVELLTELVDGDASPGWGLEGAWAWSGLPARWPRSRLRPQAS